MDKQDVPSRSAAASMPAREAAPGEAKQAELAHLAYVLDDVRAMYDQRLISERGYRFLTERYERRRALLQGAAPGPQAAPIVQIPLPSAAPTAPVPAVPAREARPRAARPPLDPALILLWLGAFLVTTASLIFVGYSWSAFSGPIKAALMAGFTGAFLGAGWVCQRRPRVRPAGYTFLMIGGALTPLTFVAAYNFWLQAEGMAPALLGMLASLVSAALYVGLTRLVGGRLYPIASVVAAEAAFGFGLAYLDLAERWWPPAAAAGALLLLGAGTSRLPRSLVPFQQAARWLSAPTALVSIVGATDSAAMLGDAPRATGWPAGLALVLLAVYLGRLATWLRQVVIGLPALILATAGIAVMTSAAGGGIEAIAITLTLFAVAVAGASIAVPAGWRPVLARYGGVLATLAPWLAVEQRTPFVVGAGLGVATLAGLAWRRTAPGWLCPVALLATAGYTQALGWLGREPSAIGLALAEAPLLLLASAGVVWFGIRLGRTWAAPFFGWQLLMSLFISAVLTEGLANRQDPAVLVLAVMLVVCAALIWGIAGPLGSAIPVGLGLAAMTAAVGVTLYRAGVEFIWWPIAWGLLGWVAWWLAPRRGEPAWWLARLQTVQQRSAEGLIALSLLLMLAVSGSAPEHAWWTGATVALLVYAGAALTAAMARRHLAMGWVGPALLLAAGLTAAAALNLATLNASYLMLAVGALVGVVGLILRHLQGGVPQLGRAMTVVGGAGTALAVLSNLVLAVSRGPSTVAPQQASAYLILTAGMVVVAFTERRPRWLYMAAVLLGVALGFGVLLPIVAPDARLVVFAAAAWLTVLAGLGLRRALPAAGRCVWQGGLGLAAVAVVVESLSTLLASGVMLVPVLLLVAVSLGSIAASERREDAAEAAAGAAVAAILVQLWQWRVDVAAWYGLPVGLWLFAMAWGRSRQGEEAAAHWLSWAGVAGLLAPSVGQGILGDVAWQYLLMAGVEGLVVLAVGLRWRLRALVSGGALAVSLLAARQVFDGLRSLPSWAIIGVAGLVLLATALVLLLGRDDLTRARRELRAQWQSWH